MVTSRTQAELEPIACLRPPSFALSHVCRFGFNVGRQMARCLLGALNSEGFCERMLRASGQVMTEGNTLLKDDELEKLTVLRMNKKFMKFMRTHYNQLTKQQFNRTVVSAGLRTAEI